MGCCRSAAAVSTRKMSLIVGITAMDCWSDEDLDLSRRRSASNSVASHRPVMVTGTVVWRLSMSRAAMDLRMGVSGTDFMPPEDVESAAARTSHSRMRPPWPEGESVERSTRCCLAARRARGEAGWPAVARGRVASVDSASPVACGSANFSCGSSGFAAVLGGTVPGADSPSNNR